jgi:hypothetical protein
VESESHKFDEQSFNLDNVRFVPHMTNDINQSNQNETIENKDLEFLEVEANLVVHAIRVGKDSARSRSSSADLLEQNRQNVNQCARSRSTSIEILDEYTLQNQQFNAPYNC